jgi:hypothetical protein
MRLGKSHESPNQRIYSLVGRFEDHKCVNISHQKTIRIAKLLKTNHLSLT